MPGVVGGQGTAGPNGGAGSQGTAGATGAATEPEIFSNGASVTQQALQLVVTSPPPSMVTVGVPFSMTVAVEDNQGHVDTSFDGDVRVSLVENPGGARLGGPIGVMASHGIAVFSGLSLDAPGKGYQLRASAGGTLSTPVALNAAGSAGTPTSTPTPTPTPAPTPTPTQVAGLPSVVKSKKGITGLTVGFNQSLQSASADNPGLYHVFAGAKRKPVFTKALKIRSVTYDSSTNRVTIQLQKPIKGMVEVAVDGAIEALDGTVSTIDFSTIVR
jgi:hypothetical protein